MKGASWPTALRPTCWATPTSASTLSVGRLPCVQNPRTSLVLKISGLDVSIQAVTVLRDVTLELPTGMMAGLIGRNGAGKTSLMRSIMGLLPPRRGTIEFGGVDLSKVPSHG